MSKTSLSDLNNHLFAQMERLSDEDITQEDLHKEVSRSKAINGVAKSIIENAQLTLDASRFIATDLPGDHKTPEQFKLK